MSIPENMIAVRSHGTGGPEVIKLDKVPVPAIDDDEILVRNNYSGVNYVDIMIRSGSLPVAKHPHTHGREATGVVVKVGKHVTKFKEGDNVGYTGIGSLAQFYTLKQDSNVFNYNGDTETTAAAILQGLTAYVLTTRTYKVQKSDYVLVHSAAGGTGAIIVQLAKLFGAVVIAVTSSEEKIRVARAAGADYVINYKAENIVEKVKQYTSGKGVQVVYDPVGQSTWKATLESAAKLGHVVSFGYASGPIPPFSVSDLAPKSLTLSRPTLFNYFTSSEEFDNISSGFFRLVEDGSVKITVSKVYPIEQVAQAFSDLESGTTTGKLLIKIT